MQKRFEVLEKRTEMAKVSLIDNKEVEKQRLTELAVQQHDKMQKESEKVAQRLERQRN